MNTQETEAIKLLAKIIAEAIVKTQKNHTHETVASKSDKVLVRDEGTISRAV